MKTTCRKFMSYIHSQPALPDNPPVSVFLDLEISRQAYLLYLKFSNPVVSIIASRLWNVLSPKFRAFLPPLLTITIISYRLLYPSNTRLSNQNLSFISSRTLAPIHLIVGLHVPILDINETHLNSCSICLWQPDIYLPW